MITSFSSVIASDINIIQIVYRVLLVFYFCKINETSGPPILPSLCALFAVCLPEILTLC
ncbi:Uncharacterized protein YR821_0575 [Yersinia ruckeri]|nr:hypothetical protein yruck0001_24970 [Yersinia ruckeri ATCC 29473]QTD75507.1 Uncharacterized protein YR821_0575 [Yersinia ruckeri]